MPIRLATTADLPAISAIYACPALKWQKTTILPNGERVIRPLDLLKADITAKHLYVIEEAGNIGVSLLLS